MQYDYIEAYLDFYKAQNFTIAREIIDKYIDYPVISWRNYFYEMANQLSEYDGEKQLEDKLVKQLEKNKQKTDMQANADKSEYLKLAV